MAVLYASIPNVSNILSVSVTESHGSNSSIAVINCYSHTLTLGDSVTIDLGYETNHTQIFKGYVKLIERDVPNNTYAITCYDEMIRAVDYFIAPENPNEPFTRTDILAEDLLEDVFALGGSFTLVVPTSSYFYFVKPEVKLISIYDFAKQMATLLAWDIWADRVGAIHFANRKPYPMDGGSGQPGDVNDVPIAKTINRASLDMLTFTTGLHERNLRNRIVVWGANGIYASASAASNYLPAGFYKTAFLSTILLDSQASAQDTADYNLELCNHADRTISVAMVGDPTYEARKTVLVTEPSTGINNREFYIFSCEHAWSREGYSTTMELRDREFGD